MNEPIQYAVSTSIPSRSIGEGGDSELRRDIVAELCALLGDDVVLLPVQSGSKSPKIKDWQTLTAEDMRRAEYRAELSRSGNVGVLLGNGLITIDLDQDSAVKSFLVLNPKLSGTLRTRRVRGCQRSIAAARSCVVVSSRLAKAAGSRGIGAFGGGAASARNASKTVTSGRGSASGGL